MRTLDHRKTRQGCFALKSFENTSNKHAKVSSQLCQNRRNLTNYHHFVIKDISKTDTGVRDIGIQIKIIMMWGAHSFFPSKKSH